MRSLSVSPRFVLSLFVGFALGLGAVLRSIWITWPAKHVFDEVYFPVMANAFLEGRVIFDAHPPLGKYLIAIGLWLFGDTPLGWRSVAWVFGIGLIALTWVLTRDLLLLFLDSVEQKAREDIAHIAGALAALVVAIDGHFIVYSRLGLMDGIQVAVMMLTVWAAVRSRKPLHFVGVSVLLGLTAAIKWPAAAILPVLLLIALRRGVLLRFIASLPIAAVIYALVVMSAGVIEGNVDPYNYFIWWHKAVWQYQMGLTATHPWGSVWYTWPLLAKPVLLLRDTDPDGATRAILALPNLLSWWGGGLAVIGSSLYLLRHFFQSGAKAVLYHPAFLLIVGWGASFLPWAFVDRVVFMYHYLPAYFFTILLSSYWAAVVWRKKPWVVIALVVLLFGVTLYFTRVLIGIPTQQSWFDANRLVPTWVY